MLNVFSKEIFKELYICYEINFNFKLEIYFCPLSAFPLPNCTISDVVVFLKLSSPVATAGSFRFADILNATP